MNKSKEISDAELVLQYQSGNKKALITLVTRWHKKFCNHAYWYTNDSELSKDIVQESWAVIIDKMKRIRQADKFGSWGLSIITRKEIDSLREQNKYRGFDSYTESNLVEEEQINESPLHKLLLKEIKGLPMEQQIVLKLFYVEGYKIHQIAATLNIVTGTVKSRLFTAREKLKTILKKRKVD